jgi:hypothetical protein
MNRPTSRSHHSASTMPGLGSRGALLRGAVRLLGSAVLLRRGPVGLLLSVLLGRLPVPGRGLLLAVAGRRLAVPGGGCWP